MTTTLRSMHPPFQSFTEFWPFYVCEHRLPATRRLHFIGTFSIIPLLVSALLFNPYLAFLIPLSAYAFAWYSHFFIEKNRPATFTYPLWSLLGDFKMFALMCGGKMEAEVERCLHLDRQQAEPVP